MEIEEFREPAHIPLQPGEVEEELTPEEQALQEAIERGEEMPQPPEPEEPETDDEQPGEEEEVEAAPEEGQRVPLAELLKEREKSRQLKAEMEALNEKVARGEKRMEELFAKREQQAKPAEEPDPEPNRDEDYLAWMDWKIRQQDKLLSELRSGSDTAAQRQAQIEHAQRVATIEQQFAVEHPDYSDSLKELGVFLDGFFKPAFRDPATRQGVVNYFSGLIVNQAMQDGANPAAAVYEMARYVKAALKEVAETVPEPQAQPERKPNKVAAKAARRSLSNVGSGESSTPSPTYDDILNMTDEQYEKFKEKYGDSADQAVRSMLLGN